MADFDIFKRTCCIKCVEISKSEIEDYSSPSVSDMIPEDEEMQVEEEEQINEVHVMRELECMKRRIQKLQLILKAKLDECPEEECVDFEIELKCSENNEICALQKAQYKLQCQIKELVRCCKLAKDQIAELRSVLCQKSREILALQKAVAKLESWRLQLDHEFGVCIERFEYLKHVKAEWQDVVKKITEQNDFFAEMEKKYITKYCFLTEKRAFIRQISAMKEMCSELHELQMEQYQELKKSIANINSDAQAGNVFLTVEKGWNSKKTDSSQSLHGEMGK